MLRGLTALAGGLSYKGKRLCQKVKSAFMRIRYLRPRAEVCGKRILAGRREDSLPSIRSFPATSEGRAARFCAGE